MVSNRRRVHLDVKKEVLYCAGGEALESAAQRGCGCPNPGSLQDQVEQGSQQPGLEEGGLELDDL